MNRTSSTNLCKYRAHWFAMCLMLCAISPVSKADGTGKLQFMFTAFLDVDALIPKTLASCVEYDPSTAEPLKQLYEQWRQTHGVFQGELQQLVRQELIARMGQAKAEEFIVMLKTGADEKIAPMYFPQNHKWKDDAFCKKILPGDLKGEGLMIRFKDYVEGMKNRQSPAPKAGATG